MDGVYYNLWSTDNDKTDANDDKVIKSVYDPSPVGYSLPASNAFTGFTTTGGNVGSPGVAGNPVYFNVKGGFDKGWYFYIKPGKTGDTFFFQATGYRIWGIGNQLSIFLDGNYWTSGVKSTNLVIDFNFHFQDISPLYQLTKNWAFPVRSAEEEVLKHELDEIAKGVWVKERFMMRR